MREDLQSFLRSCLLVMLRPLAKFCVARGIRFQDFVDLAKIAFVKSAEKKLTLERRPSSVSRLSVMTGIQRPEINRILKKPEPNKSKDFIVRIIGQWSSNSKFTDKKRPKKLSVEGLNSDFAKLTFTIGSDLNPHTVRFELERLGLIEVKDGYAKLLNPVYVTSGDPKNTIRLGSYDVEDLLTALQENAFNEQDVPNLQARTEYDNISDEELAYIREWLLTSGSRFHEQARKFISKFDRDINKSQPKGTGRNRVVLGTYSRVEAIEDQSEEEE